jgi:hypothetical protein
VPRPLCYQNLPRQEKRRFTRGLGSSEIHMQMKRHPFKGHPIFATLVFEYHGEPERVLRPRRFRYSAITRTHLPQRRALRILPRIACSAASGSTCFCNGRFFLADATTKVTVQILGADLSKNVGKMAQISDGAAAGSGGAAESSVGFRSSADLLWPAHSVAWPPLVPRPSAILSHWPG